ncbi:hypothetical protein BDW_02350 [Bdellovibrio bacteriovorus W]|nr:hypothetical protein BDW_02350 [Bdellovibrio bacteriovorus W]
MKSLAKVQWEDPLTFRHISEGERVSVSTQSGIMTDFMVQSISEGGLLLVPLNEYTKRPIVTSQVILAVTTTLKSFKVKSDEIVSVTNKKGDSARLKVAYILNGRLLVLHDPKYPIPWLLKGLIKLAPAL